VTLPDEWFAAGVTCTVNQEHIQVTSEYGEPDKNWKFTDAAGHEHYRVSDLEPYPTLRLAHGEGYWCRACSDEHEDSWFECGLCGEKITLGMTPGPITVFIPGLHEAYLENVPLTAAEREELERDGWQPVSDYPKYGLRITGSLSSVVRTTWDRVYLTEDETRQYMTESRERRRNTVVNRKV
jgi:hypothetical protein